MRTVAVKDVDQQTQAMLFRTYEMFVWQRTQFINAIRSWSSPLKVVHQLG